jgi:ribosomal protein L11 methyltransferase
VRQERAENLAPIPADLLIANIHYDVLKEIIGRGIIRLFRRIILSGLMRSQVRDVKAELRKRGAEVIQEWDHEMTWYTLLAVCRSSWC